MDQKKGTFEKKSPKKVPLEQKKMLAAKKIQKFKKIQKKIIVFETFFLN
tara:strand:- start:169 stop:315 length:147 start_codon:yes stop_codon:yes gene_type:complete